MRIVLLLSAVKGGEGPSTEPGTSGEGAESMILESISYGTLVGTSNSCAAGGLSDTGIKDAGVPSPGQSAAAEESDDYR